MGGGAGSWDVEISSLPNEAYEERSASVTITCGKDTRTLYITQAGLVWVSVSSISWNLPAQTFSSESMQTIRKV